MAVARVSGIRIAGIANAVPEAVVINEDSIDIFGEQIVRRINETTGIESRHVASAEICTSDLCEVATHKLLKDLSWEHESIDLLVFVSQTPDYLLPATACSLHGRLGLSPHCVAFDVNLGCSGYVYGLWMASQLMQSGAFKRGLLAVGDTISRIVSPEDRASALLIGDAGSVTALERDDQASDMVFDLGTDGSGESNLIVPAGGFRMPTSTRTQERTVREKSNIRSDNDVFMDGTKVFTFTLRTVPNTVASALDTIGWDMDTVDAFVMHQANRYILRHLAKKMDIPEEKFPICIKDFGNTSGASIPLTMTEMLADTLRQKPQNLILSGFGVGWSWATAAITCGPMVISELSIVSNVPKKMPADL
ncbi:beta-ketoacyl-ACP synthase 3 [bacterium]|nr:beta-ketoacyl-ACP synthase 3 [bacterium]